jgi:hypothetical protein
MRRRRDHHPDDDDDDDVFAFSPLSSSLKAFFLR